MYRRFITELADDIAVDFESQEIKEICSEVADLSSSLLNIVQESTSFFKSCKILLGGSIAERTRIWRFTDDDKTIILEFDFLSVLESFHSNDFEVNQLCQGFANVKQNKNIFPEEYVNDEEELGTTGTLNAKMVTFMFKLEMMKAVNDLCACFSCEIKDVGQGCIRIDDIRRTDNFSQECTLCNRFCKTGTLSLAIGYSNHPVEMDATLVFKWKRNVSDDTVYPCEKSRQSPSIEDEFIILVDFLPAIELVRPNIDTPSLRHVCNLVPKGCKNGHNTCWKISHSNIESEMLKSAGECHRKTYMALKFILDYISCGVKGLVDTPKTYILKTAILHHIQSCKNEDDRFDECVLEIMSVLSNAYKIGYLPHYFQKFNLLEKVSDSMLPPEDEIWFQQRNEVMAECWNFIKETFEDIEQIVPSEYDFDKVQTVLKVITLAFGQCWSQTDFRDIYLPDKSYFRGILKKFAYEEYPTKSEMEKISQKFDTYKSPRFTGRNLPIYFMSLYRSGSLREMQTEKSAEFFHGMNEAEMLEFIEEEKKRLKINSKRFLSKDDMHVTMSDQRFTTDQQRETIQSQQTDRNASTEENVSTEHGDKGEILYKRI